MSGENSRRALVVDDSLTVRIYHSSLLRNFGYEVDTAENGLEALEMAMKKRYDLILSDINMPVMDGFEFVRKLRKLEDYRYTPVVFITTLNSEEDRRRAILSGGTLYIVKPINLQALEKILRSL
ncbi:MAG TPA: response regulator [Aquifex aeolicus]|uniref:Response regulator n=1 Tax=Aquifex aeolicus TaxID=63363 RepID=A0A7C5L462_AQUAO|nr:response regulator [Aquifex aeolicus]